MEPITFVAAVNDPTILETNLLASPCLSAGHPHELILQSEFPAAALAYNDALERAANDLIVFVHQDVLLPAPWVVHLELALDYLAETDSNWGVLGCGGITNAGELWTYVYSTGWGILGRPFGHPRPVQSLDEMVLVLRRSSGLRFDTALPHYHLYGTDICLKAAKQGKASYAIDAFCIHNTEQLLSLPEDFYRSYRYIKRTWKDCLPIQTCCIKISRWDSEIWRRRLHRLGKGLTLTAPQAAHRVARPQEILERLYADGTLTADQASISE